MRIASFAAATVAVFAAARGGAQTFERVYPLKPEEGVFAYARVSPDGRHLAYASEAKDQTLPAPFDRLVTIVDLDKKTLQFTEPGIDPYWSTEGERVIYYSIKGGHASVSIWHQSSGTITRDVAPMELGDYYSWGKRDGRDLVLTIQSFYYYLNGDAAVDPQAVNPCPGIGRGERPLLSKDGKRLTTFVRGTLVIRNLTDCNDILDTGLQGAKADFSWDGRYVAFHAPKRTGDGYDIVVVDLEKRTSRVITNLKGSSYFPSWTKDGRLCFRYDGDDYRGFMMASNVLSAVERELPKTSQQVPNERSWHDIFPETPQPVQPLSLVMVWATWSAHSPDALLDLQHAEQYFAERHIDIGVMTATDPGSRPDDVARLRGKFGIHLAEIPLAASRLALTEAENQVPVTLLFRGNQLIGRRLGAQTFDQLKSWVELIQYAKP